MTKNVPKPRLILFHGDLVDDEEEIKKVLTSPEMQAHAPEVASHNDHLSILANASL